MDEGMSAVVDPILPSDWFWSGLSWIFAANAAWPGLTWTMPSAASPEERGHARHRRLS